MGVEQIRGPVQGDSGLAGAGPALDHENAAVVGADDRVLLGLESGDDVVHAAGAAGVEEASRAASPVSSLSGTPSRSSTSSSSRTTRRPRVVRWRRLRTPCGAAGVAT